MTETGAAVAMTGSAASSGGPDGIRKPDGSQNPDGGAKEEAWARMADLPCDVAISLPAPGLRVRDLLGLAPGFLVRTTAPVSADVPLWVNGRLIAWCEFEVVHDRLGVRVTELA
jgi:flagellar motor switch/type III secretory pathway protein FliN